MFGKRKFDIWESISDLMTGLMVIFLFISLAFLLQVSLYKEELDNYKEELDIYKAELAKNKTEYFVVKNQIYVDLSNEFMVEELNGWGAVINPDTMAVTFKEPEVLFDVGKNTLKDKFKAILTDFFPRYIQILQKSEYKDKISEIRIEGYASLESNENPNLDTVYFYNMQLSQDRARNVLQYIFTIPAVQNQKQWLRDNVITNGYSYSKSGINNEYDRRVEFRVLTTAEQELRKLVE